MILETRLLVGDNNAPFTKTLPIKVKGPIMMWRNMMWRNKMCREWRTKTEIKIKGLTEILNDLINP